MTSLTDLEKQLAGQDAQAVRKELLAILKAGEDRWRRHVSVPSLSPSEFSKARTLLTAYEAAIALLALSKP